MASEPDHGEDPLEDLDAAWEKERESLQTKGRWYNQSDPTAKDARFLTIAGVFFLFLGGVYLWAALTLRDEDSKLNPLYTFLFVGVAAAYFVLARDVRTRLARFRIAKEEYLDKRKRLESKLED